ncbi:cell wall hydrolase [Clostridium sp. BJN0001]|uniref:cell wall hydrolase n=1 Tax=Clostridium sp. BJN0001 TaxID=2930219 RepID=UPI001FD350C5|nr:cell wall hydrolase [Clostridium sp. BJN0001]
MKKICSIFFTALVFYLFIFNISSASATVINVKAADNAKTYLTSQNIDYQANSCSTENSTVEVFSSNSQKIYITKDDINLMAKLVAAESIGEPYTGKVAVASVVLNRVITPGFPNTIKNVIFQKNAFSCVRHNNITATPNKDCYSAVYDAIKGVDPTNRALFFYNPQISTCSWMKGTAKVNKTIIGHHTFFKIKA